jgi:uncharacterized membrane protein (DUF441 family)
MGFKRLTGWTLGILGAGAIVFQSWIGCRVYWLGKPGVTYTYSMPCLSVSIAIGAVLLITGLFLLQKKKGRE